MKKRIAALAVGAALMGGVAVPAGSAFGARRGSAQGCGQMISLYNTVVEQYNAATDPYVKAAFFAEGKALLRKILRKCS
jgi:hypothetical protein